MTFARIRARARRRRWRVWRWLLGREGHTAYARWRWLGVPQGAWARDWRLCIVGRYRHRRLLSGMRRRDCLLDVLRDSVGMVPKLRALGHPDRPWGHGYYDVEGVSGLIGARRRA